MGETSPNPTWWDTTKIFFFVILRVFAVNAPYLFSPRRREGAKNRRDR